MASFNEVCSFVSKYLKSDGKSVEAITSYIRVDEEKIKNDRDDILDFLANNIYFMHEDACPLINLTKDLESNRWNNLTTAFEYEIFEQLVAICFEVGLLVDNFVSRMELANHLGPKGALYLNDEIDDYREFLDVIVNRVLPNFSFQFNSSMLVIFMPPLDLSDDDIKFFLNRWYYYYSHEPYTFADLDYFNTILENNLQAALDFALYQYAKSEGSTFTVRMCKLKKYDSFLTDFRKEFDDFYKKLTDEHREEYDRLMIDNRNCFFNQIALTFSEKYEKKERKYE